MSSNHFPIDIKASLEELKSSVPDQYEKFLSFASVSPSVLDDKTKELVALGAAVAQRCPYCIKSHTAKAVDLGVSKQELSEVTLIAASISAWATVATSAGSSQSS